MFFIQAEDGMRVIGVTGVQTCALPIFHAYVTAEPHRPLIGASGGISGVVAAYLILYPRVKIWGLFLKGIPLHLPAYWTIGFWFALQFASAFLGGDDSVGWFAHLGGFLVDRKSVV